MVKEVRDLRVNTMRYCLLKPSNDFTDASLMIVQLAPNLRHVLLVFRCKNHGVVRLAFNADRLGKVTKEIKGLLDSELPMQPYIVDIKAIHFLESDRGPINASGTISIFRNKLETFTLVSSEDNRLIASVPYELNRGQLKFLYDKLNSFLAYKYETEDEIPFD